MNGLSTPLVSLIKRFGHQQRIIILNYHRVLDQVDPMAPNEPDATHFEHQLCWIKTHFPVIGLSEAVELLSSAKIDSPKVVITFDDGYRNNAEIALPILQKHGLTASFFVVTDELSDGIMWNDIISEAFRLTQKSSLSLRPIVSSIDGMSVQACSVLESMSFTFGALPFRQTQAENLIQRVKYLPANERQAFIDHLVAELGVEGHLPRDLMMTPQQVKLLSDSGMTVGAHACKHDVLTSLSVSEAKAQIVGAKRRLETITGKPVDFYAYPNGKPNLDFTPEHITLVKEAGYKAALATTKGAATSGVDMYQLPRIMPWRRTRFGFNLNLLETLYQ